jgi:PRTRC genetic system ThiF family protein
MLLTHELSPELFQHRALRVLIVGAGGTGSAVAMGLPYLDQAMRVWGRTHGLEVTMMDADVVSETNCIRQPFSASDIGLNKATVLINRINLFWGTAWSAAPTYFQKQSLQRHLGEVPDLLIGCVDTRAARKTIAAALEHSSCRTTYWLDIGNNADSGQFVLGQPLNGRNRRKSERLRTVGELYPEIAEDEDGEDPLPSCSAVEALERQEPFINQVLASSALAMLARLLRYGRLSHHGGFYNAATGRMSKLPVDPLVWKRTRRSSQRRSARQTTPTPKRVVPRQAA